MISGVKNPVFFIWSTNSKSLNYLVLESLLKMISCGRLRSSPSDTSPIPRFLSLPKKWSSPFLSTWERLRTIVLDRKYAQRNPSLDISSFVSKNTILSPVLPRTLRVGTLMHALPFLLRTRLDDFYYLLIMRSIRKLLPIFFAPIIVTMLRLEFESSCPNHSWKSSPN